MHRKGKGLLCSYQLPQQLFNKLEFLVYAHYNFGRLRDHSSKEDKCGHLSVCACSSTKLAGSNFLADAGNYAWSRVKV